MAATFVVEDGTGLSTANAYVSLADADQYWDDYGEPSDWTDDTDENKELAIRKATQYIDATYSGLWLGVQASNDQALDWPRSGVYADRYYRDSDSIPKEIENAACEMALRYLQLGDDESLIEDQEDPGAVKEYSFRVGDLSESTEWVGGKSDQTAYTIVTRILRPLLQGGYVVERG